MEDREIFFTDSVEETEQYGAALAKELLADASLPRFIALCGDLGVGKTAFVRGFVSVFSPASTVLRRRFRRKTAADRSRLRKKPLFLYGTDLKNGDCDGNLMHSH